MDLNLNQYESCIVAGIDEAGRGPLAGPVVAAGVVLDCHRPIIGLNDSKKLTEKKRESLFLEINDRALVVAISEIDAAQIDRINILQATLLAMKNVLIEIHNKIKLDWALIDGNMTVASVGIRQRAIVKGDTLVPSIMAASIIAKVHRDRMMKNFDERFPGYGFADHKGYGTKKHMDALTALGPCSIHRLSFAPLKSPSLL